MQGQSPTLTINFLGGKRMLKEKPNMLEGTVKTLNHRQDDRI